MFASEEEVERIGQRLADEEGYIRWSTFVDWLTSLMPGQLGRSRPGTPTNRGGGGGGTFSRAVTWADEEEKEGGGGGGGEEHGLVQADAVWEQLDPSHSGRLDGSMLEELLEGLGVCVAVQEVQAQLVDGEGRVQRTDFMNWYLAHLLEREAWPRADRA